MNTLRSYNIFLIISIILISLISLLNMKSADFYSNTKYYEAQTVWFIIGFIIFFVMSQIEISFIQKTINIFLGLTIILLLLTLVFGKKVYNARRWLEIFGITIQASEAAKVAIVLFAANFFENQQSHSELFNFKRIFKPLLVVLTVGALIFLEPDLGTTLLIFFVFFSMVIFEGFRFKSLLKLVIFVVVLFPVLWFSGVIKDYQKDRIRLWLYPDKSALKKVDKKLFDKYMQPKQALWSVGSGGVFGKGLYRANPGRLRYLFALHTDYILTVFAEEEGFVGTIFLLMLYFYVVFWCFFVGLKANSKFKVQFAFGTGMLLLLQIFMNVGMVTGLLPVVGITLPLMSYGGSSTLVTFFSLGIVFRIARESA